MKKLLYILFALSSSLFSQTPSQRIEELLNSSFFDTCLIAVHITNESTGETVFSRNSKMLLHPASNMKIITSSAGLLFLGPEYTFHTALIAQGKVSKGTFTGDLIIRGGADPDFTDSLLTEMAAALKQKGITRIKGRLIGDVSMVDSLYWGNGWMWDDDPSFDAPYLSALNINNNGLYVTVTAAEGDSVPSVTLEPETGYMPVKNRARITANPEQPLRISRNYLENKDEIIIEGDIRPGREQSEFLNVSNPPLYFMTLFRGKLLEAGFRDVPAPEITRNYEYSNNDTIYTESRRFDSLIVNLNKTSDNLSTEMVLRALAHKYSGSPASARNGVNMIDSMIVLLGMNPSVYRIVDGSGVSHYNLVTAELLHTILAHFYRNEQESGLYQILRNSFPIAGVDGTLENRMKTGAAFEKVYAKTGTLSGVSCLSGYTVNSKNETLVFSIMMQNHYRNIRRVLDFQNAICTIISE